MLQSFLFNDLRNLEPHIITHFFHILNLYQDCFLHVKLAEHSSTYINANLLKTFDIYIQYLIKSFYHYDHFSNSILIIFKTTQCFIVFKISIYTKIWWLFIVTRSRELQSSFSKLISKSSSCCLTKCPCSITTMVWKNIFSFIA